MARVEPPMRVTTYYRWSLALPICLPLAVILALAPLTLVQDSVPFPLTAVLVVFVWSLIMGGVPYLILAGGLWFWMRGKSERGLRRITYLAPLVMIGVYALCLVALSLALGLGPEPWESTLGFMALSAVSILGLGYLYVFFIDGLRWFLKRKGIVVEA